jgi:hypothetical protein
MLGAPLLAFNKGFGAIAKEPLPAFDLSFMDGSLSVIRRSEWTQKKPLAWRLREGGKFDRITINHQGGSVCRLCNKNSVIAVIDSVYAGHRHKNYGDIAYHFVIDYAGRVWEARSLSYEGAHVCNQNKNNIGVLVLGNYEKQLPSEKSVETLGKLTTVLRGHFGIKHHRVYGHRDLGASLCPGENLYPHVVALRAETAPPDEPVAEIVKKAEEKESGES